MGFVGWGVFRGWVGAGREKRQGAGAVQGADAPGRRLRAETTEGQMLAGGLGLGSVGCDVFGVGWVLGRKRQGAGAVQGAAGIRK